ncbi:MAG TPA: hypothetical protein PKA74_04515 [Bauldia sp.]|nr:hypothetical protein [Bauldia sp.]
MLRELLLLGYAGAVGYVSAGIAASLYKLVTLEPARFRLAGRNPLGLASGALFCALTGPVIVVGHAVERRRKEKIPLSLVFGGIAIAALWSCCLGILMLELILTVAGGFA